MFCPNCGTKLEGGDSKKLEKWVKDAGRTACTQRWNGIRMRKRM